MAAVAAAAAAWGLHLLQPGDPPQRADPSRDHPSRHAHAAADSSLSSVAASRTAAPGVAGGTDSHAALSDSDYQRLNAAIDALLHGPQSDTEKFAVIWRHYQSRRHSDPVGGQILLDATMSLKGRERLPVLIQEFDSPRTPAWARARLVMLIGHHYHDAERAPGSDVQPQQARIRELVARAVHDPDATVAREAVINHARLAASPDGQDVLDRAFRRQLLTKEEFLRESILRLPSLADADQQRRALDDIQASSTHADAATRRLLSETVSVALQDAEAVRALSHATRASLLQLMMNHAPSPASGASHFAMSAAASYYDWAVATGALRGLPEPAIAPYLAELASASQTTPAQAAALMLSPRAPEIAQALRQSGQSTQLLAKLQAALASTSPATAAHSVYSAALAAVGTR